MKKINLLLLGNDLRLSNNKALSMACETNHPTLLVYIFDPSEKLNKRQKAFVYLQLKKMQKELQKSKASLYCKKGDLCKELETLSQIYKIEALFQNTSYTPYEQEKSEKIKLFSEQRGIAYHLFKDAVIFEKNEILSQKKEPYKVYTAYKNSWKKKFISITIESNQVLLSKLLAAKIPFPTQQEVDVPLLKEEENKNYSLAHIENYAKERDYPYLDATTHLSPHLRFGTVSIRFIVNQLNLNDTLLDELIWREFFHQIIYHYPNSAEHNFKPIYDSLGWINNEDDFKRWKEGKTGYPMVDAGMRELNKTGYMHNRTRMITASFLCKHLLIDWKKGEAYFADKLLDYDPALNVGNWQWVAGTGCDTMPYFRIFNPTKQQERFDPESTYIRKWIPEIGTKTYPEPIVPHTFARDRAITNYKKTREKK